MSKKKSKKTKSKKRQPIRKPKTTSKTQKKQVKTTKTQHLKKMFLSGFTLFAVFVSVVSALYAFYPRVSIVTSEQLFPYHPFKNPFYVYNSGNTSISNFEYYFVIKHLELTGDITFTNGVFLKKTKHIGILGADRKRYLSFENILNTPPSQIKKANIEIHYSYGLPFIPYKFNDKSSFQVQKTSTGRYVWFDNN